MAESENMVKILLKEGDDVETLWAVPVSNTLYRLDNSPFYAYGISWEDVVEAKPTNGDEGFLEFVRVVEKSGNRTVRVIFKEYSAASEEGDRILNQVKNLGCSYEGIRSRLISINIPANADFEAVVQHLIGTGLDWEYADPTYDELFPEG